MATSSVDLLSVLPGLQISASDVTQAELALTQVLQTSDATLDLRQGTAIRDLVVRPNATLLATINTALTYYWTQNNLNSVNDSTPAVFVDNILSNFFMTRFTGSNAVINIRLYFAKNTPVTLTTDAYFSTDNVLKYFPATNSSFSSLTLDPSTSTYYVDVDVTAEAAGVAYNISTGSLIYFSNFNAYFLHAEINYLTTIASNSETNTQFISRAKNNISTRNLINTPSIISNIQNTFQGMVTDVYPIGMGDADMIRDMVQVWPEGLTSPVWVHSGGCVDIYCNVPLTTSLVQFTTNSSGDIIITGAVYKVTSSTIPGGVSADEIPSTTPFTISNSNTITVVPSGLTGSGTTATVISNNHGLQTGDRFIIIGATPSMYSGMFTVASVIDLNTFTYTTSTTITSTPASGSYTLSSNTRIGDVGFSTRQSIKVSYGSSFANQTVTLNMYLFNYLDSIQTYLEDPANRVLVCDQLARGFNFTQLDISVIGYGSSSPDQNITSTAITKYLTSLLPGQIFIMGDLLAGLSAAGITSVKTPLTVTYTSYLRDLLPPLTGTITDVFDPNDDTNIYVLGNLTVSSITPP